MHSGLCWSHSDQIGRMERDLWPQWGRGGCSRSSKCQAGEGLRPVGPCCPAVTSRGKSPRHQLEKPFPTLVDLVLGDITHLCLPVCLSVSLFLSPSLPLSLFLPPSLPLSLSASLTPSLFPSVSLSVSVSVSVYLCLALFL